jgi:hypothetical protein
METKFEEMSPLSLNRTSARHSFALKGLIALRWQAYGACAVETEHIAGVGDRLGARRAWIVVARRGAAVGLVTDGRPLAG